MGETVSVVISKQILYLGIDSALTCTRPSVFVWMDGHRIDVATAVDLYIKRQVSTTVCCVLSLCCWSCLVAVSEWTLLDSYFQPGCSLVVGY